MPGPHGREVPRATYRVQLHAGFTLDDAAALVPYLAELGVSHLYASPVLQAAPGSTHGYDVVDHSRVSAELGGADAFERLTDTLRAHGMGLVLDIVPNHMAISSDENRWWWDVLEHGPASRYAAYFDVELADPVLLPVLPDDYRRVLDAGGIRLARDGGRLLVEHGERRFPLDPLTAAPILASSDPDAEIAAINADADRLDRLLTQQHYRLASWRAGLSDLRYRRFFDVNDLIGLRMEDPAVFDDVHRLVLRWVERGLVDGLRVDHPDGLRDPAGYLARLRAAAPEAWIVVEKILAADEALPAGWPVDGTTGYGFANLATGLFVDPAGEAALSAAWASVADAGPEWDEIVAEARGEVLSSLFGSDLNRLTDAFARVPEATHRDRGQLRQALCEVAARVSVYRTYLTASPRFVSDVDAGIIERAVASATAARSDLDPDLLSLLGRVLRLEVEGAAAEELAMRFQQLTPAAMAKGVEDTAFYRHHRLVALNEVGGDPGRFGTSVAALHQKLAAAAADWPAAMLSLSTHDTKRSADVRARLALLSEDPAGWQDAVERLGRASRAAPCRGRPADGRGRIPLLPDPDRRMADRHRARCRLSAQGEPRGEAAHVVGRAGRGLRSGAHAIRARRPWATPTSSKWSRLPWRRCSTPGAVPRSASSRWSSRPPECRTCTRATSCGSWPWSIRTTAGPSTTLRAAACSPMHASPMPRRRGRVATRGCPRSGSCATHSTCVAGTR